PGAARPHGVDPAARRDARDARAGHGLPHPRHAALRRDRAGADASRREQRRGSVDGAEMFAKPLSLIREVKSTIRRLGVLFERLDGLYVTSGPVNSLVSRPIAQFPTRERLPSITDDSLSLVRDGTVLMAYSANLG